MMGPPSWSRMCTGIFKQLFRRKRQDDHGEPSSRQAHRVGIIPNLPTDIIIEITLYFDMLFSLHPLLRINRHWHDAVEPIFYKELNFSLLSDSFLSDSDRGLRLQITLLTSSRIASFVRSIITGPPGLRTERDARIEIMAACKNLETITAWCADYDSKWNLPQKEHLKILKLFDDAYNAEIRTSRFLTDIIRSITSEANFERLHLSSRCNIPLMLVSFSRLEELVLVSKGLERALVSNVELNKSTLLPVLPDLRYLSITAHRDEDSSFLQTLSLIAPSVVEVRLSLCLDSSERTLLDLVTCLSAWSCTLRSLDLHNNGLSHALWVGSALSVAQNLEKLLVSDTLAGADDLRCLSKLTQLKYAHNICRNGQRYRELAERLIDQTYLPCLRVLKLFDWHLDLYQGVAKSRNIEIRALGM